MGDVEELQACLGPVLAANQPGGAEHVLIALPSFSVGGSLLDHYAERIPALEHRYLNAHFLLHRIEGCELVFVSCQAPAPEVVDYLTSLVPAHLHESVRSRFRTVVVDDSSSRSVAAKLLDRPDLLDDLRASFRGRPAFIEPWNVTVDEIDVALRLGAPINGTAPELWPLGFKSAGRKLFRDAGVATPLGHEDIHTVDEVAAAIDAIHNEHPHAPGAVIKLDDSGAGDGNLLVDFAQDVTEQLASLPDWYVDELQHMGGVVEERIAGERFTSPSVQVEISPTGEVQVLATHEQVIGGDSGQVYTGCRFPADPVYAAALGRSGAAVGRRLADLGVLGRLSVDFVAASDGDADVPTLHAIEVNLRKGGTTHPYAVLRNLVPGHYEPELGQWQTEDGSTRAYTSTDNLVDERWIGLPPSAVIAAVADAGLQLDYAAGTGVVLHMLSGLAIDGRFGFTAIGRTIEEAAALEAGTRAVMDAMVLAPER